jgi:hypothetical protein
MVRDGWFGANLLANHHVPSFPVIALYPARTKVSMAAAFVRSGRALRTAAMMSSTSGAGAKSILGLALRHFATRARFAAAAPSDLLEPGGAFAG